MNFLIEIKREGLFKRKRYYVYPSSDGDGLQVTGPYLFKGKTWEETMRWLIKERETNPEAANAALWQ